jgi:hypothetical protein
LKRDYPGVTVLDLTSGHRPSVPELRHAGVRKASGEIVAVIEEHKTAPAGWLHAARTEFRSDDAAIGGPILDGNFGRVRDWVVYFSEYHNYLPPWKDGDRSMLNGANIAYRRGLLQKHDPVLNTGFWEVVLHPLLAGDGKMRAVSSMGAHQTGPFDFGYYLKQRYLVSRAWGGTRRRKVNGAMRLAYLLGAPLFPGLLLARIAHRVFQSGRYTGPFLKALPLLVPVVVAYVWGEWRGYLTGPGNALEQVE